ncbi:putative thiamine transport system ATP-binding protein [Devosia enhydra]|uniref:Putative thiamine transport system ATP-binding protein n=1 Tax=Devosia enhydra TaxID=665118 RepID=A0A1K2HXE7_9HYPH|nr:ATP-binding cassette domain-containing protein [Devosia enhydra]SFZ84338.1 putative thiamine transport system ATP-binding protein [Devosia enhydra]
MNGTGSGLRIEGLVVTLSGAPLVGLDARIAPGEVLTLMGPSGVGKSSLLLAMAGFLQPPLATTGRVMVGDLDLMGERAETRRLGLVFQDALLFPHLSVGGNIAFGMAPGGGRKDRHARVEALLDRAGLPGFSRRDPATLSGGERARVALLRAVAAGPRALLLDEPFSRLDPARRADIRAFTFGLAAERGLPTLLVTHDMADAEAAAGPVTHLDGFRKF